MAVAARCRIIQNRRAGGGFYLLRLAFAESCRPGQFVMLRLPGQLDPLLGRPISIHDHEGGVLSLLYQVVGRGTGLFAGLLPGQELEVLGPLGNGFPLADGGATLIGGGVGVAPLYFLAKELKRADPARRVTVHLGFREEAAMEAEFRRAADELFIDIGGYVTEAVDFTRGDTYYACGPTPMLRSAVRLAGDAALYVSLEERMACGAGACLGCTVKTKSGNRRVCKDGPVFPSSEVLLDER